MKGSRSASPWRESAAPTFLSGATAGGWIDRLDAAGNPATDFMPASSLYHLPGAIDELTK
jgi:mannose/cellobiose epimerase-like protein (N-acyl-D-glucosamine 2-epimerase family)